MNCHEFEMKVLVLAREQLMDSGSKQSGLEHTQNCVGCRGRLREERALITAVKLAAREMASEGTPDRVEAILLEAFRETHTATARSGFPSRLLKNGPRKMPAFGVRRLVAALAQLGLPDSECLRPFVVSWPKRRQGAALQIILDPNTPTVFQQPARTARRLRWRVGVAAAALVALALGLAMIRQYSRLKDQKHETIVVNPESLPKSERPNPTITSEPSPYPRTATVVQPARAGRRNQRPRVEPTEEVTEFFPLIDELDLDSLEAVQSVRVELSALALADLGLVARSELQPGSIKADILLGHDGLAQAIRFVH